MEGDMSQMEINGIMRVVELALEKGATLVMEVRKPIPGPGDEQPVFEATLSYGMETMTKSGERPFYALAGLVIEMAIRYAKTIECRAKAVPAK
jgi:hypothetical protein